MIGALKGANLALAFLLELVALVAFAFWGWTIGSNAGSQVLLAVVLPVVAATVWGAFLSPKPQIRLPDALVTSAQLAFFVLAVLALWGSGHRVASLVTAGVVAGNRLLIAIWRS